MPKILPAKERTQIEVGGIMMSLEIHYDWRMSVRISLAKDRYRRYKKRYEPNL